MGFKASKLHGTGITPIRHLFRKTHVKNLVQFEVPELCIPTRRKDGRWDCMVRSVDGKLRLCPTVGPFSSLEECAVAFCH